jgi:hypothetical protein
MRDTTIRDHVRVPNNDGRWSYSACPSPVTDGDKAALYDLPRAEFRVVTFVHDVVLIELPEAADYRPQAEALAGIMITAMKRIGPDVFIRIEYAIARRLRKDAKATYAADGRLVARGVVANQILFPVAVPSAFGSSGGRAPPIPSFSFHEIQFASTVCAEHVLIRYRAAHQPG